MSQALPRLTRVAVAVALVVGIGVSLPACSSSTSASGSESAGQIQTSGATVLDVRTPQEYADGHLEGARNLDVSSSSFQAALQTMPKQDSFVVYCRSGNRSAAAAREMTAAGFTNVVDAGGIQEAEQATGLPVVTS